jgi:hypothetical protein
MAVVVGIRIGIPGLAMTLAAPIRGTIATAGDEVTRCQILDTGECDRGVV